MDKLIVSNAPHIHTSDSSRRVMLDVVIALLPATVAAVVIFGTGALKVIAACVIGAVVSEALFDLATHRKQTVGDFSAVVTGLLLGLNLSSSVPVWQCVVGSAFAIIIVKCLFGGLGHNFANPAISGRVFMLLAFSEVAGGAMPAVVELEASATPLELISAGSEQLPSLMDMFLGLRGGARAALPRGLRAAGERVGYRAQKRRQRAPVQALCAAHPSCGCAKAERSAG